MPQLAALSVAVPDNRYSQSDTFSYVEQIFSRQARDVAKFKEAFLNTGISYRHLCRPVEWFFDNHGWRDRNEAYISESLKLLERVAVKAVRGAGTDLKNVTDIVLVSSTGIATPSLDALLMERLGFASSVRRTPVFGLGCAGGLLGLARANQLASASPDNVVLLLVVELCSLNFIKDEFSKSNIIASALFADGAAGAVISDALKGPRLAAFDEHRWPDSLGVMGWQVTDSGLGVIFSKNIPTLVGGEFGPVLENFLKKNSLKLSDIDHYLSHPGGAKVVDALESLFALPVGGMNLSRQVLANYGNMSAPTVLFVLNEAMEKKLSGRWLMSSFGPGFTAGLGLLEA